MSGTPPQQLKLSEQPCDPPCKKVRREFSWTVFESALAQFTNAKEADPIRYWDDYFSALALVASLRSKDPKRRVGAVVVSADRVLLATGYNWLPRGVKELPERFSDKREKLKWITHAETNAIFNASRTGISLVGGTVYATTFPCASCAQAIVQAGIVRVFCPGEYWESDPNGYHLALEIFADAGIAFDVPRERERDAALRHAFEVPQRGESYFTFRFPEKPGAANDGSALRAPEEPVQLPHDADVLQAPADSLPTSRASEQPLLAPTRRKAKPDKRKAANKPKRKPRRAAKHSGAGRKARRAAKRRPPRRSR